MTATKPTKGRADEPKVPVAIVQTRGLLEKLQPRLHEVLPEFITPERMVRLALLAMNRQPDLLKCTPESIAEAVMQIAAWGLEIGRTAHLVPYGDKATAIPDYKGRIELAIRGGSISSCRARLVYERDRFEVEYGLIERLVHVPASWNEQERGKTIGVYAIVMLPSGEPKFELMSAAEVEAVRSRSKAKANGPWVSDWGEMAKKSAVNRLLKMVPQNPLLAKLPAEDELETPKVRVRARTWSGAKDDPERPWRQIGSGENAFNARPDAPPRGPLKEADYGEEDERRIDREILEREGMEERE